MKEFIERYQKTIVGVGALSVLVLCYFQQKEIKTLRSQLKVDTVSTPIGGERIVDSLIAESDSLNSEIFILQTEIGRHELTRDVIFTKHPKVGDEYSKYFNEETE
jgi:translation initiation factor 6 (eIF-6)